MDGADTTWTMKDISTVLTRTLPGQRIEMIGKKASKERANAAFAAASYKQKSRSAKITENPLYVVSNPATVRKLIKMLQWDLNGVIDLVLVYNGLIVPIVGLMREDDYCNIIQNYINRTEISESKTAEPKSTLAEISCDFACDSGSLSFVGCSRSGCKKIACVDCFGKYCKEKEPAEIDCPYCKKV